MQSLGIDFRIRTMIAREHIRGVLELESDGRVEMGRVRKTTFGVLVPVPERFHTGGFEVLVAVLRPPSRYGKWMREDRGENTRAP